MKSIRILIEAMPRMLREIIEGAVLRQPDMFLVDCAGDPDLATAVKRRTPDVVIVADANGTSTASHQKLLIDNPELKVFVVTDDGRSGYWLECRRRPIAHMSPEGLIAAIRAALA